MKPKLSNKRYASEEQVMQWEKQTINGLLAVKKQIDKTSHHIDSDLQDMTKFLHKADKCLQREKELAAQRPSSPDAAGRPESADETQLPTLRSAPVAREEAVSHRDSRARLRLEGALERGREDGEDDDVNEDPLLEEGSLPASPPISPSRMSPAAAAAAACDEEISEDEPLIEALPVASSPEPAEEVEE